MNRITFNLTETEARLILDALHRQERWETEQKDSPTCTAQNRQGYQRRIDLIWDIRTWVSGALHSNRKPPLLPIRELTTQLRDHGAAVVVFTEEELRGAPSDRVEDRLIELGWGVINCLGGGDES